MRLVRDDQIKESHIEVFKAPRHRGIGRKVDALGAVARRIAVDDDPRLTGQVFLKCQVSLLAQLAPVAQKQDSLGPARPQKHVAQRDGNARLTSASRLDQQCPAHVLGKAFADALHGFDLVDTVGDVQVGTDMRQRHPVLALEVQVFKAVLGVEAVHLAVRIPLHVIPQENVDAVRKEDGWSLASRLLQTVGIKGRLGLSFGCILGRLLRLDDGQGLAVIAIQNIVGSAIARFRGHPDQRDFLADLFGADATCPHVPADLAQQLVNQTTTGGRFAKGQDADHLLAFTLELGKLGLGMLDRLLGLCPSFPLLL